MGKIPATKVAEVAFFGTIAIWLAGLILVIRPLSWDEIENFRATRWVGRGLLPYRDFWEHHTPLLWLVEGPIARLLAPGAGTWAVVTMRVVQLLVWLITFTMIARILKSEGVQTRAVHLAFLALLLSRSFTFLAVEFRPDPLAEAFLIAGLALVFLKKPLSARHWITFGALVSAAVLTNMRLVPLALAAGALMLIARVDERKWGFNWQATWMLVGVVAMASAFVFWLWVTRSLPHFLDAVFTYNITSNKMMLTAVHGNFSSMVRGVLLAPDIGAWLLLLCAVSGALAAWRHWRDAGPIQILTILSFVELISISRLGASHPYHLQCLFLLMTVPAANGLLIRWRRPAVFALVVAFLLDLSVTDTVGAMTQQNSLMLEVDRRTSRSDVVLDGVGYALNRTPAYRYWFMPLGVVLMAKFKLLPQYGARELIANPPGAIIYTSRLESWFDDFPDLLPVVRRNYLPRQRALWIPALNGIVSPQAPAQEWVVLTGGMYRAHAVELLAKHPWFRDPLEYAKRVGPDSELLTARLEELPHVDARQCRWTLNGAPVSTTMRLRRGDHVRVEISTPVPVGIVIVPSDVDTIFDSSGERFHM